jgi:hypothetical protein
MTVAEVMGTAHPSAWAVVASVATDGLFTAGGLLLGLAAWSYAGATARRASVTLSKRASPPRTST